MRGTPASLWRSLLFALPANAQVNTVEAADHRRQPDHGADAGEQLGSSVT